MIRCVWALLSLNCATSVTLSAENTFPPRPPNAPGGSQIVKQIESLPLAAREERIHAQISAGNVPDFWRSFCPVTITNVADGRTNVGTVLVSPDYLAVGGDEDYFLTPLTPAMAQLLADQFGCALPTRKIVDAIWRTAAVKLSPVPMTPGADMITVRKFAAHDSIVHTQRQARLAENPLGSLVAGHKKDVIVTARLMEATNRVAIYGWHRPDGSPIQPLYLGHAAAWVDYSHGIRFVRLQVQVNGVTRKLAEVLADPKLAGLFSDEGPFVTSQYKPGTTVPGESHKLGKSAGAKSSEAPTMVDFKSTGSFDEQTVTFNFEPEVRALVNAPTPAEFARGRPVRLIFYALPNGNTIEQTIGKKLAPGDDWHFNIQHIGAQTRWLRQQLTNEVIVVAYLEAAMKSWPAWRQKHGDSAIPKLIAAIKNIFRTNQVELTLTSHSGGGSMVLGYINTVEQIPDDITRIAFLDSNYAYRTTNHLDKLSLWLRSPRKPVLCVIAYQDYLGLLDGKPFVSQAGGTWGRSQEMMRDLKQSMAFEELSFSNGLRSFRSDNGRITFLLKENPERKVWHTVQVERNGFIHSQVVATDLEGRGYEYFGERVYNQLIE